MDGRWRSQRSASSETARCIRRRQPVGGTWRQLPVPGTCWAQPPIQFWQQLMRVRHTASRVSSIAGRRSPARRRHTRARSIARQAALDTGIEPTADVISGILGRASSPTTAHGEHAWGERARRSGATDRRRFRRNTTQHHPVAGCSAFRRRESTRTSPGRTSGKADPGSALAVRSERAEITNQPINLGNTMD
jgi:hypothetical protein